MTRILTLAEVRTAGLAAYHAKQLSAQGPTPACRYRDTVGRPCIIGAAMTDDEADSIGSSVPVNVFHVRTNTGVPDTIPEERNALSTLQTVHDCWAKSHTDRKGAAHLAGNIYPPHDKTIPDNAGPDFYEAWLLELLQ